MDKREATVLQARLEELAEALGGRAPGAKGILVWMDALGECSIDSVKAALSDWPKKNIKMPSPVDILKACREVVGRKIDEQGKRNRETAGSFDIGNMTPPDSPLAKAAFEEIARITRSPKPGPKEWAYKLKAIEDAGDHLDMQQRRAWREALRVA